MSIKIQITQEHIDTGKVGNAFNCAIAVGLKQEFAYEISVTRMIVIGNDCFQAEPEVVRWFGIALVSKLRLVEVPSELRLATIGIGFYLTLLKYQRNLNYRVKKVMCSN